MIETLHGTKETVNYNSNIGIRVYLNAEVEDYPLHWHSDVEIITTLENEYFFEIDGVKKTLKQGEILIIPSGELHRLFSPENGRRIITIFDCSMLYNFPGFNYTFHKLHPFVIVNKESMSDVHEELMEIQKNIAREYHSTSQYKEAACYSLLINFFVIFARSQLIKSTSNEDKSRELKDHRYIERFLDVCNYINEHCTENLKIDELADIAGYSPYHFARLFKKYMNVTFYNYILYRRIMTAEKLLITPDVTIMEAALQSGFESLSTFNRVFKKQKNCTPSEFISMNKA